MLTVISIITFILIVIIAVYLIFDDIKYKNLSIMILIVLAGTLLIVSDMNGRYSVMDALIKDHKVEYVVEPQSGKTYLNLRDSTLTNTFNRVR